MIRSSYACLFFLGAIVCGCRTSGSSGIQRSNDSSDAAAETQVMQEKLLKIPSIVDTACRKNSNFPCTYAASLWKASDRSSVGNLLGKPLTDDAGFSEAIGECLLTQFAYNNPGDSERSERAKQIAANLREHQANQGFAYHKVNRQDFQKNSFEETRIRESCNIGGPDCLIIAYNASSNIMLSVSSDACK